MKYQIIYADPPWKYKDKSKSHGGGAESHYTCMSVGELQLMGDSVKDISDEDSVLLMWVTMPMLEVAFSVINTWGFRYKTCAFTWVKTNKDGTIYMGMGRHTRANAEICLLATRGKGVERKSASVKNTHLLPRGKHSQKPELFRQMIETLYGEMDRIELFARQKTKGWDIWGNELPNDIELLCEHELLPSKCITCLTSITFPK